MTQKEKRKLIFNKYNKKCAYCGCELKKGWHIDHLEPVLREWWKKGSPMFLSENDNFDNLFPSCPSCNINKHSLKLEDFRFFIQNFVTSLNKNSTQYKMAKKYDLVKETNIKVVFYFEKYDMLIRKFLKNTKKYG